VAKTLVVFVVIAVVIGLVTGFVQGATPQNTLEVIAIVGGGVAALAIVAAALGLVFAIWEGKTDTR